MQIRIQVDINYVLRLNGGFMDVEIDWVEESEYFAWVQLWPDNTYRVSQNTSFTKLGIWGSCWQLGRNTYDICGKSANTQFGKTQFFGHTVSKSAFIIQGANLQTT